MNFDKIIDENSSEFIEFAGEFHYYKKEDVKKMLIEACKQVLDEAAERAETIVIGRTPGLDRKTIVDKQSILQIKEEL